MDKSPAERCRYTWPKGHEAGTHPNQQSCCYRETPSGFDRCVWHADLSESDGKKFYFRDDPEYFDGDERRLLSRPIGTLIDGAILPESDLMYITTSLRSVSCRGSDFSGSRLSEVDMSDATLTDVAFQNATLQDVDLSEARLGDADFKNATLRDVNLSGTDLRDTDFKNATLRDVNLSGASLKNSDLSEATLQNVNLWRGDLTNADCIEAVLDTISFTPPQPIPIDEIDLSGSRFEQIIDYDSEYPLSPLTEQGFAEFKAKVSGADLTNIDLTNADFSAIGHEFKHVDLTGANLSKAELPPQLPDVGEFQPQPTLEKANLSHVELDGWSLEGIQLKEANLTNASLREVDLSGADLTDADLTHANLAHATLTDAVLTNTTLDAEFRFANLSGAILENADLSNANLSGATLKDADLTDADLSGATLKNADFTNTQYENEF